MRPANRGKGGWSDARSGQSDLEKGSQPGQGGYSDSQGSRQERILGMEKERT